jgi:hypothetical protein
MVPVLGPFEALPYYIHTYIVSNRRLSEAFRGKVSYHILRWYLALLSGRLEKARKYMQRIKPGAFPVRER